MLKRASVILSILVILFSVNFAFASDGEKEEAVGQVDTQEEINDYIRHHLQDSHDFTFFTDGKSGQHWGFPLPVVSCFYVFKIPSW
jgi:F-type H+-transporting ATPase subunit a